MSWTLELNYEIQAGADLPVLPQPAEGWGYRSEPPCLASLYLQSWGNWFVLEVKMSKAQEEAASPEARLAIQRAVVAVIGTDAPGEMTLFVFLLVSLLFLLEVWLQPSKTKNTNLIKDLYPEHITNTCNSIRRQTTQ